MVIAAATGLDLDAYFARIGYGGPTPRTVATLNALSLAHVTAIPFANVDILLGDSVSLDPAAIRRKLIAARRGGYCFEQNGLMRDVLRALGFTVTPMGGRVRLQQPRSAIPPRTHMMLRVEVGNRPWLVDVGFGGLSLTAALRLESDVEQETPHERRRLSVEEGRYFHQACLGGVWSDAYEFTLEELHPADQELANWWTSAHPTSRFRTRLVVARAGPAGTRLTIDNDQFTRRGADGVGEHAPIGSSAELLTILRTRFGLDYPPGADVAVPGFVWGEGST